MRIDDKFIANYSQVDSLKKQDNAKPKSDAKEKVIPPLKIGRHTSQTR